MPHIFFRPLSCGFSTVNFVVTPMEQKLNISYRGLRSLRYFKSQQNRRHMLRGIIACQNKFPKLLIRVFNFLPIALTAIYLIVVTAILVPLAVAICVVLVPLTYVMWRARKNRFNPRFLRIMYPFELIGLTIVNAPQIVTLIVDRTRKIKIRRQALNTLKPDSIQLITITVKRSKAMLISLRILAVLGIIGIAVYMVIVAAVVVPLALGSCLLVAPFCYLAWYVKEKKFIPLFHKIPSYLEHLGFSIVNSRKILTNLLVGMKGFKWPMF